MIYAPNTRMGCGLVDIPGGRRSGCRPNTHASPCQSNAIVPRNGPQRNVRACLDLRFSHHWFWPMSRRHMFFCCVFRPRPIKFIYPQVLPTVDPIPWFIIATCRQLPAELSPPQAGPRVILADFTEIRTLGVLARIRNVQGLLCRYLAA